MKTVILCLFSSILFFSNSTEKAVNKENSDKILSYILDPIKQDLRFYWKDKKGQNIGNFKRLKDLLKKENKELVFAMNGGMYLQDRSPQGLYIENGKMLRKVNTVKEAYGNFYLQPNGIFYITKDNRLIITRTTDFVYSEHIDFATQSGPMLVIDGKIHSKFTKGSKNVHIRNGVGILPSGKLIFAMSKETINLFDFATFFKDKGCKNALYLDGFVSRTYLPSKDWVQTDGNFGVMIAEIK